VKEMEDRTDNSQLDFKKLKMHTTQALKFYETNRLTQLHQMEEGLINKVSSTIDEKLTCFFDKEKNIQEANRLVSAAVAIDPSLRVTRDENVVTEPAVVEESNNNLPIPFVLPYIWKDESFQDILFCELTKIWNDEVIARIAKYGKRDWYLSASNSI